RRGGLLALEAAATRRLRPRLDGRFFQAQRPLDRRLFAGLFVFVHRSASWTAKVVPSYRVCRRLRLSELMGRMARRRQKIWITRAQPGAAATADRVRALGHDALVAPLLAVHAIEDVQVDLSGVAALAFTSANVVRCFADICAERSLRVFAVGAATAQAARAAGFKLVLSADGDVEALADGIGQRRAELRGAVLHPGAAEPAGDLAGALAKQGVTARSLILYETVPAAIEPE